MDVALTGGRQKRGDDKRDYRYIYSLKGGGMGSEKLEAISFGERKKGSGFRKLEIFRVSDVYLETELSKSLPIFLKAMLML